MNLQDPQTWNRYAYVRNSPLEAVDPNGLDCIYANEDGSTTVVSGDCYSDTDSGYYVDGTVSSVVANFDGNGFMVQLDTGEIGCAGDCGGLSSDALGLLDFMIQNFGGAGDIFTISPNSNGTVTLNIGPGSMNDGTFNFTGVPTVFTFDPNDTSLAALAIAGNLASTQNIFSLWGLSVAGAFSAEAPLLGEAYTDWSWEFAFQRPGLVLGMNDFVEGWQAAEDKMWYRTFLNHIALRASAQGHEGPRSRSWFWLAPR